MASVKICDGRTVVYQYDTGVSIELCDCRDFTECHFAVNDGIIRRVVEDNICSVPDAALMNAGTLTVYAFSRNDDGGQTQHTFFIHVMARPKPADYIDPPDEVDNLDALAQRVAPLISGGIAVETDPTVPAWAKQPSKPTYTAREVGALPADAEINDAEARRGVAENSARIAAANARADELSEEINDLKESDNGEYTPAYVTAEAQRVAGQIREARTDKSLVLLCAADIHTLIDGIHPQSLETTRHLAQGMYQICKRVPVDGIAILGDSVTGGPSSTVEQCKDELTFLREALGNTPGVPQFWVVGNHDHNSQNKSAGYLTAEELYAYIGANTTSQAVTDYDNMHRMYGYLDYAHQRIRLIYLNTSDITDHYTSDCGVSAAQAEWFIDTLESVPATWGVVVMSHHPLNGYTSNGLGMLAILDAYKGRLTGSVTVGGKTHAYNFSDSQGELICHLHGHIHNYQVGVFGTYGVLSITIPNGDFWRNNESGRSGAEDWGDEVDGEQRVINKVAGTAEDTAYTAVVIDRKNGVVHALRCGAGVDRIWDYVNGVEIEPEQPDEPEQPEEPDDTGIVWHDGYRLSSADGALHASSGRTCAYLEMDDLAIGEGYNISGLVFNNSTYKDLYDGAFENDVLVAQRLPHPGNTFNFATYYSVTYAADENSMTVYKIAEPDGGISLKFGVSGGGNGEDAIVTKVGGYANQIPLSVDTDGNVYNGTGYKTDCSFAMSSGVERVEPGITATGYIPIPTVPCIVRVKDIDISDDDSVYTLFAADFSPLAGGYCNNQFGPADENGVRSFNLLTGAKWIRISGEFGANPIVSMNAEIPV